MGGATSTGKGEDGRGDEEAERTVEGAGSGSSSFAVGIKRKVGAYASWGPIYKISYDLS